MRAAAGDEAAARAVAEEVSQLGWHEWAREAIRARVDPHLVAAVLPEPVRVEVVRVLVAFYSSWRGGFPREYRRVLAGWLVQRDRWRDGNEARVYEKLLAAMAPPPALAGVAAAARARAASLFGTTGEDCDAGRRPPASVEASPGGGHGAQAAAPGAMAGGLGHGSLSAEDGTRDADPEVTPNADGADTAVREETDERGLGETVGGGADGVQPNGARVTSETGPEALEADSRMERLLETAGRGPAAVKRLRDARLGLGREAGLEEWLTPPVSRTRERAGR